MANMTFGVNLIPKNSNNTQQTLGNSENKWDIYANKINGEDPVTLSNTSVISYTGNEKVPLRLGNNNVYTDLNSLSSYFGGSGSGQNVSLTNYTLQINNISSLPYTNSTIDSNITSKMVVLESTLSNPAAQTGDWTITTTDGYVTIDGNISGTTNLTLVMGVSNTVAPTIQTNLSSNAAVNLLQDNPKPGVTGILPVAYGGTGAETASGARTALNIFSKEEIESNLCSWNVSSTNFQEFINCTGDIIYSPWVYYTNNFAYVGGRLVIDNFSRTGGNPGARIKILTNTTIKNSFALQCSGYVLSGEGIARGELITIEGAAGSQYVDIRTTETFYNLAVSGRVYYVFSSPLFLIN